MPLILKPCDWPEADLAAWDRLFAAGDIFEDAGPCRRWSEGTRRLRRQSYGHWLGYLARNGLLDEPGDVTDRATPEALKGFAEAERTRCATRTAYTHLESLHALMRAMAPEKDWSALKQATDRLRLLSDLHTLGPRPPVTARQVHEWAIAERARAEGADRLSPMARAVAFRDGLMVDLLIQRPLRLRSFICLDLDRHVVPTHAGVLLRFAPEDMKDRKARDLPVPDDLVEPLRRYLDEHRPILLQGADLSALWVSRRGAPLGADSFQAHLADLTRREFGVALRPHAFRHIAATWIAEQDPAHVGIIAAMLGHATLAMSQKHYNRARMIEASNSYQNVIAKLRLETRPLASRSRKPSHAAGQPSPSAKGMGQ